MAKTALRVAELDFDTIKYNLKNFLRGQTEFTDYDFEGSGLSVLIDLLAYNTHYNAVIGNMLLQEMYLDTAVKKESLALISKRLGYTPKGHRSAQAIISLMIYPDMELPNNPPIAYIYKDTPFTAYLNDNTKLTFITRETYSANLILNNYSFVDIPIFEGALASYKYVVDGTPTQKFEIPSQNVDTTKIRVFIQTNITSTDIVEWKKRESIIEVGPTDEVFFLKMNENLKYEIYFGDNNIGKRPVFDNVVIIEYMTTNGVIANNIKEFTYASSIDNSLGIQLTVNMPSIGGADPETLDEIRTNAQNSVFVQNRAVIDNDYENIINEIIAVDSVSVYGGETIVPPQYGKVFICLKQAGTETLLTESQRKFLLGELRKSSVLALVHEIVDPEYIYLETHCTVRYNPDRTSLSESTLKTAILTSLIKYSDDNFNKFNTTFEYSRFVAHIDNIDPCIIANTTKIKLYKSRTINMDVNDLYIFDFKVPLEPSNSKEKNITCTPFRNARYIDTDLFIHDVDGNINVIYYSDGNMIVAYENVGTVDYANGIIKFNFNIGISATPDIKITVIPSDMNISVKDNSIMIMRETDINITMHKLYYNDKPV